jgi:hypothetical protein
VISTENNIQYIAPCYLKLMESFWAWRVILDKFDQCIDLNTVSSAYIMKHEVTVLFVFVCRKGGELLHS